MKSIKTWELLGYAVLFFIMLGQATTAVHLLAGQSIFLLANLIGTVRALVLGRPKSDVIKEVCCLALTIGIILLTIF